MRGPLVLVLGLVIASTLWSLSAQDLQVQIDRTPEGQTVTIPPGTYQGNLIVRKSVVIEAQPGAKLVHPPGTTGPTLWIQGSDITVTGLEIEGTGTGGRRDQTALLVSGSRVTLGHLKIRQSWSGVWLDNSKDVSIDGLEVTGLAGLPFWQRGEGVRITDGTKIQLQNLRLESIADGIYGERAVNLTLRTAEVLDARYGLHLMFSHEGEAQGIRTLRTVAGVMVMESDRWVIRDSAFVDGYRTGSAGVREIRTKDVRVLDSDIARQASGIELVDVRGGLFQGNRITENGVAWTWGGDNTGTRVQDNDHRGNLLDFAGESPGEKASTAPEELSIRPTFDRNYWDGWKGTDLNQDGIGDTPYRFDQSSAAQAAARPWAGIFLGSPWSQWSNSLPGGEVIDGHPRTKPCQ